MSENDHELDNATHDEGDDSLTRSANLGEGHNEGIPGRIGSYTIKRMIATGGMGAVYEARQENPRRVVAVKVIRQGISSPEAVRRFQQESQVLARLRHTGIAQIYEAGVHQDGATQIPFFALEYIPNAKPITEYCKAKNLSIRQRLKLFLQVCEAVHYGHQRGVIHRDLKPANILVDSEGRTKIIDFGVARTVDADLKQTALQTRVGQIIGTAHYMSPEQFEADPNDLDTRSDVYALGVLLYELLSGNLPYNLEGSGIFEVARIVRNETPTPLGANGSSLKGELEIITDKALSKDREHRYQSAFGLAEDIRRYLKGEAISAKPTSLSYQLKVFTRRNKTIVSFASIAVVLLVAGVVISTYLYYNMKQERERAAREAERAVAASEFLKSTLGAAVGKSYGEVKNVSDICDIASSEVGGAFADSPETEADIRITIGNIYRTLHRWNDAERELRRALEIQTELYGQLDEGTISSMKTLAHIYDLIHEDEKELRLTRQRYNSLNKLKGPASDETLDARFDLALLSAERGDPERAIEEYRAILALDTTGNIMDELRTRGQLARALLMTGDIQSSKREAESIYRIAVETGGDYSDMARSARNVYAEALIADGQVEKAKSLYGHKKGLIPLGIEREFQGSVKSLTEGIKLIVFFETWCPYSQEYVPKLVNYSKEYGADNIDFLGLTRVNRSATDAGVKQFIADNQIDFAIAKENGRAWNYFECSGTPTTIVLHNGEIVWENWGESIPPRVFEGLLSAK